MGLSDAIKRMKDRRGINKKYRATMRGAKKLEKKSKQQSKLGDKMIKADLSQQSVDWKAQKRAEKESLRGMRSRARRQKLSAFMVIVPTILIIIFIIAIAITAISGIWLSTALYLIGLIVFIYLIYFKESIGGYGNSYGGSYEDY